MSSPALDVLRVLDELFPAAFKPPFKLLKIGIYADLLARAPVTKHEAKIALRYHCGSTQYLRRMIEGAARVDLDGVEVGIVTADEAATAKARIVGIKKLKKERMAAAKAGEAQGRPLAVSGPIIPPPIETPAVGRFGRPIISLKRKPAAEGVPSNG